MILRHLFIHTSSFIMQNGGFQLLSTPDTLQISYTCLIYFPISYICLIHLLAQSLISACNPLFYLLHLLDWLTYFIAYLTNLCQRITHLLKLFYRPEEPIRHHMSVRHHQSKPCHSCQLLHTCHKNHHRNILCRTVYLHTWYPEIIQKYFLEYCVFE